MGEIVEINSGRDYKHLDAGDIPVYGTGGYMLSVSEKLSDKDAIGIGRKGTIDKPQLLKAPFWTVDTLFFVTVNHSADLLFIYYLFNQIDWRKLDESTGVPSLSKIIIERILIKIPSLREQQKIGEFFKRIDHQITLQQRKLDLIKQAKKTLLAKMFPKNNEKVPEFRFKGFTDAWEQRKLGEIVEINSGRDYKHLDAGDIPVYGTGGYMLSVSEKLSDKDAIGIGRKGTIDKPQLLKAPFWTVDTLFFVTVNHSADLLFIYYLFNQIDWRKLDESTGVPSLSKIIIERILIKIPSLREQQKIGEFFKRIDHQITLQQHKPLINQRRQQNAKKNYKKRLFSYIL